MQWYDETPNVRDHGEHERGNNTDDATTIVDPSHRLLGRLEIGGEFLLITLQVTCAWKTTTTTTSSASSSHYGHFVFECHASARFWTKTELVDKLKHQEDQEDHSRGTRNKKDKKIQDKIRTKLVARLREDAFISKLLVGSPTSDENNRHHRGSLLAQADIQFTPHDLEERVTVMDDICEAMKRAIWPSAESPLDVVELLLALPLLPTTDHNSAEEENSITITTTSLANRARLRLLEDAMCEACEKEGEEELLDDLTILDDEKKANDNHDSITRPVPPPRTKKGKTMTKKKT